MLTDIGANKLTRRQQTHLKARAEILNLARKQMADEGASAMTLRNITTKLGVTAPAIYRYFKNRDELISALISDAYQSFIQALEETRNRNAGDPFPVRMVGLMTAYREWALTHPQDYILIFNSPFPNYTPPMEMITPLVRRTLGVFINELAAAIETGEARPTLEYQLPSDEMAKSLSQWKKDFGYDGCDIAVHLALAGWIRLHGMVSLELSLSTRRILGDASELFRSEMMNIFKLVGG